MKKYTLDNISEVIGKHFKVINDDKNTTYKLDHIDKNDDVIVSWVRHNGLNQYVEYYKPTVLHLLNSGHWVLITSIPWYKRIQCFIQRIMQQMTIAMSNVALA